MTREHREAWPDRHVRSPPLLTRDQQALYALIAFGIGTICGFASFYLLVMSLPLLILDPDELAKHFLWMSFGAAFLHRVAWYVAHIVNLGVEYTYYTDEHDQS